MFHDIPQPILSMSYRKDILDNLKRTGIAVLEDFLTGEDLDVVRQQHTDAYTRQGFGSGVAGAKEVINGKDLKEFPAILRVFAHPELMPYICELIGESDPWLAYYGISRYLPGNPGIDRHSDSAYGELIPEFANCAIHLFLDDIGKDSGAFLYAPGTHLLHYEDGKNTRAPSRKDLDGVEYKPVALKAGSALFRIPAVWHAVNPVSRLRRAVAVGYASRTRFSVSHRERSLRSLNQTSEVPELLQQYWLYESE